MRTVFIGTSGFAVAVLERLAASPHRPVLVLTRPDSRRGRGRQLASPPVAVAARALGIELAQPESVNDEAARGLIGAAAPEALCVCAYGALIKEPLLSEHPILNVHPSLLPRWRGAAPIERALMSGDEVTGVSIMRLTAGLDSGPVCAQAEEEIAPDDTYGTLADRLARLGGELLVDAFEAMGPCEEQDDAGATYAEKISSDDRRLDPTRSSDELERVVRALTPQVGAWLALEDGHRLGVSEARAVQPGAGDATGAGTGGAVLPGEISLRDGVPALVCAEGELLLLRVKPPGGREMGGEEWARGHLR